MTRQTLSYVRRLLEGAGIRPDTRKGQNFLVDLNLVDYLARAARLTPEDVVLEVGTGTGSLTQRLVEGAGHVVTVEIDRRLYELAGSVLEGHPRVTRLLQDVLKNKNRIAPNVLGEIESRLGEGRRFKVVANLPYNVATPVISNLLIEPPLPERMVVTIQKELADRILARPRTKDYGALSIWVQSQCRVRRLKVLPPGVFWPRPKVTSAILEIRPEPARRERLGDVAFFHRFVRALFLHRRKFLRAVLVSGFGKEIGKEGVDRALAEGGWAPSLRAEQLDLEEVLALCNAVARQLS